MVGIYPHSTSLASQRAGTSPGRVLAVASIPLRFSVRGRTSASGPVAFLFYGSRLDVPVFVTFGKCIGRSGDVEISYGTSRSPRVLIGARESCGVSV